MPNSQLKPSLGRIVVELVDETDDTISRYGSLYVVNLDKKASASVCRVVATCDPYEAGSADADASPAGPQFRVGDLVVCGKWQGTEVTLGRGPDARKYIILDESSILCSVL